MSENTRFEWAMAKILVLCLACAPLFAAPPSGGGGTKVSVTAANPSEALQGEELDVIVSGTGFDSGSTVNYLVTGTTDASQVEVLSVQYISSTELKTRIRPKEAALPSEYDIEVRTLSGRKGKGTTLFRVKQSSSTCVDTQFPTIAYAVRSEFVKKKGRFDEPPPQNVMLTGDGGCTEHTLVANYPWPGGAFRDLKFAARDGLGVVSWIEATETDVSGVSTQRIKAVFFDFLEGGVISTAQPVAIVLHEVLRGTAENTYLESHDIRLDADGFPHIALVDFTLSSLRNLRTIDPATNESELIFSGSAHFLDSQGTLYRGVGGVRWSPSGDALYFLAQRTDDERLNQGLARVARVNGAWLTPQLLVVNHHDGEPVENAGVSADGLLAYTYMQYDIAHTTINTGLIDPDSCVVVECDTLDGVPPEGVNRQKRPQAWTNSGSLLFWSDADVLGEWTDPELGTASSLSVDGIGGRNADSSL